MSYTITTKPSEVGAMPNQIHGTLNGRPFYFRARHGEWAMQFDDYAGYREPLIASGGGERLGQWDALPGWWAAEDALKFVDELLQKLERQIHGLRDELRVEDRRYGDE